jgi:hypothetical protein
VRLMEFYGGRINHVRHRQWFNQQYISELGEF